MQGRKTNFLVYSSVGDARAVSFWNEPDRNFDVCIAYYGESSFPDMDKVEYFISNKDYKVPNFVKCLKEFPAIQDYDYVLWLDDDLLVSLDSINRIFEMAESYQLDLCQPSLMPGSDASWRHTYSKPGVLLEYVNFVEVQAPCISNRLLRQTIPYLDIFLTDYGLDLLWWKLLQEEKDKIAVLHSVKVFHPLSSAGNSIRRINNFKSINREVVQNLARALNEKFDGNMLLGLKVKVFGRIYSDFWRFIFWRMTSFTFMKFKLNQIRRFFRPK